MTEMYESENEREDIELTSEEKITYLEAKVDELQNIINTHFDHEHCNSLDTDAVKNAFNTGSECVMNVIRPYLDKYHDTGMETVEKVESKVVENPIISVVSAFGIGIAVGTVINAVLKNGKRD